MASPQINNPLHGITLETMLRELVERLGWAEMGRCIPIRCFTHDPSIASSLKFLRRTPWARTKVEALYLVQQKGDAPARPAKRAACGTKEMAQDDFVVGQSVQRGGGGDETL